MPGRSLAIGRRARGMPARAPFHKGGIAAVALPCWFTAARIDFIQAFHAIRLPSFFFQAEDGIRYSSVTGVKTCALPISGARRRLRDSEARYPPTRPPRRRSTGPRSEERRVGKECRSKTSPYH